MSNLGLNSVEDVFAALVAAERRVNELRQMLSEALSLPLDTAAERYAAVYWTVDDLLDPGCNGLAINWDLSTARACLNDLKTDLAQAMCEAGREHLEIFVPLWAARHGVPAPVAYDEDDYDPGDEYW